MRRIRGCQAIAIAVVVPALSSACGSSIEVLSYDDMYQANACVREIGEAPGYGGGVILEAAVLMDCLPCVVSDQTQIGVQVVDSDVLLSVTGTVSIQQPCRQDECTTVSPTAQITLTPGTYTLVFEGSEESFEVGQFNIGQESGACVFHVFE